MPDAGSKTRMRAIYSEKLADEDAQVGFGARLARALEYCGCIFLIGELGAGKTTLTRGVLRSLGYSGAVKSPTYTLLEPYEIAGRHIYHFDLYRLGDPEELEFIGVRDLFSSDGLHIVEWPSRGEGWLPQPDLIIEISILAIGREVTLRAFSTHGEKALTCLEHGSSEAQ